jgi:hypothetical protein
LLVHICDPPTNQAAFLESQVIPTIQYVPGPALKPLCGAPEKERGLIADSTKSALAAAKAKGVKLGNPQIEAAQGAAVAAVRAEADRAARNVLPIICEIQKSGSKTLRASQKR